MTSFWDWVWCWPWSTIWTFVAAIAAWAAVAVYYRTLNALTETLQVTNGQTDNAVFAEIFAHIGTKELRKDRHQTIFTKGFDFKNATSAKKEAFRNVMVAYSRAALIVTTDSQKARLLNLQSDGIWHLVKNHSSGIRAVRNPIAKDAIPRPDYGRALEDLWNWGVDNQKRKAEWNVHWPDQKVSIDRKEGC